MINTKKDEKSLLEQIKSLHQDSKLSEAHNIVSSLPSNTKFYSDNKELFEQIKREFYECSVIEKELESYEGWKLHSKRDDGTEFYLKFGSSISLIQDDDDDVEEKNQSIASVRLNFPINSSLVNVLSCLYELDLYKTWVYGMKESGKFHDLSKFCFLNYFCMGTGFLFMADRDLITIGYGNDDLLEKGRVFVFCRSLAKSEFEKYEKQGIVFPKQEKRVRVRLNYGGFFLEPITENKTMLKMIFSFDPMLSYIPNWMVNMTMKLVCPFVVKKIREFTENNKNPIYQERIKTNTKIYGDIKQRVDAYFKQKKEKEENKDQ